jgi:hypothetical protein
MPANPNFRVISKRLLAGLMVLSVCALARGVTVGSSSIVAPNSAATADGNSENSYPFAVAETIRYQQVYMASQFGAVTPGGEMITQIAFRPNASDGYAFSHTIGDIRIDLSTTLAAPGDLSLTFADNVGANDKTVFNGPLTLSSADTGPAGGPKNFDILIQLATPFFYNPAAGNLLLDLRNFSSGNTGGTLIPELDGASGASSMMGRVYDFDASAAAAQYPFEQDTIGLVTQFTVAQAPEPAAWALLGLGGLLMARRGRLSRGRS